nr:hypothetical protein [uncultured Anaeromusa sp.]
MRRNPFEIISPEDLTAEQADQFFVEMYSDYPEITREGNVLITGARGCGKSMLIRCSLPDVLMIREGKRFSELPFVALCVPIKKTSLNLQELRKLDDKHAPYMLNEHFMSVHVVMHMLHNLSIIPFDEEIYERERNAYEEFYQNCYLVYLRAAGYRGEIDVDFTSAKKFFNSLHEHMFLMACEFIPYLISLFDTKSVDYSYSLPLLSFTRFIVPVFKKLSALPGFPQDKPLFIFIDDADNLSKIQTEILNSWLACRTQPTISLKVSSQIGLYKTFLTSAGILVESPHDYQDINISYLYTTKTADFHKKATDILRKRLKLSGIEIEPEEFFPSDKNQEQKIKEEEEKIRRAYSESGRGYREGDDVRRYATPNFIRDLGGTRKSRMTYKYAGLDNVIHLSSGIIRYLLDAVAKMYDKATNSKAGSIKFVSPSIQDEVMRAKADFYLFNELRKSEQINDDDLPIATTDSPNYSTDKLGNLINAMGKTFHEILISDRSERKVFSIALSNQPDSELKSIFNLGVRLGFLHESLIGNKDGNGRTTLYVLNRCFAPIFTLDPTGFQGYLFMTNEDLKRAIYNGKQLREIVVGKSDKDNGIMQLTFADFWEA